MKKIFIILICLFIIVSPINAAFAETQSKVQTQNISVYVDGLKIDFDVQPVEKDSRVLIPFRAIAEAINVQVEWHASEKAVYAKSGDELTKIKLVLNNKSANLNGKVIKLDVPTTEINGRILVPIRFFSEAMGCNVQWDSKVYGVRIAAPVRAMEVLGYYALGDKKTSSWTDLFEREYPNTSVGNTKWISELAFGWYGLDVKGNLLTKAPTGWQKPQGWEDILQEAAYYNLKTQMAIQIVETTRDSTLTNFLSSEEAMDAAVANIVKEASLFNGINLDFEGLGNYLKDADTANTQKKFTYFVSKLYQKTQQNNIKLTLSLHPLNSSYLGYDYKALSEVSDSIVIMAYEYQEGDIEPASRVEEAVRKAVLEAPKERLSLAININKETPNSIVDKIVIAKRYNLKGIALWRLGLLSDEMWSSLKKSIYAKK